MTVKIYAGRDLMELDKAGDHYCRHVYHMTKESLHSKSDIAAELGWRDMQIAELQSKVEGLAAENAGMNGFVDSMLHIAWHGGSADGFDIQDAALANGLIRAEAYRSDEHENLVEDPGNFEDGDTVYLRVETPATDAELAGIHDRFINDAVSAIADSGAQTVGDAIVAVASMRKEAGNEQ